MKKYILIGLLLFTIGASAQIQVDSLIAKQKIKLHGYYIKGVSNDTTIGNQDSSKVMTEAATKMMVLGRAASRDVQIAAKVNYTDSAAMLAAYRIALNSKQSTLVSGTNIKTVNGSSILGSGDITAAGASLSGTNTWTGVQTFNPTVNSTSIGGANGTVFLDTLKASGNYDSLAVIKVKPYFNDNGYSNVFHAGIKFPHYASLDFGNYTGSGIGSGGTVGQINFYDGYYSGISQQIRSSIVCTQNYATNQYSGIQIYTSNNSSPTLTASFNYGAGGNSFYGGNTLSGGVIVPNGSANLINLGSNSGSVNTYIYGATDNNVYFKRSSTSGTNIMSFFTAGGTNVGIGATSDDGVNLLQVNGSTKATSFNSNAIQTTLSGGSGGSAIFSQPYQGGNKMVIIHCSALNGATSTYTFPTAFAYTPAIISTNGLASSIVTTLTTSTIVLTGTTSTGTIIIAEY